MQFEVAKKNIFWWLWKGSGKGKIGVVFLIFLQAGLSICSVMFPWMLRGIIDNAAIKNEILFYRYICIAVIIIFLQILMRAMKRFMEENTKSYVENQLKEKFFSTLLLKDYTSVTCVHSGEWMNRLTSDTVIVADSLTTIIPDVIGLVVKLMGALFLLYVLIPSFSYWVIPCGLISVFFTAILRRNLKKLHKEVQENDGKLRIFLTERLNSFLILRTFAKEKTTIEVAREKMKLHKNSRMKRMCFNNICNTGFSIIMNCMYMIGALYCGIGIMNGSISYGSFMAVLQSITQIQSPFASITGYLPKYYAMIASTERLMEIEVYKDTVSQNRLTKEEVANFYRQDFQGIGLENVTFSYSDTEDNEGEIKPLAILQKVNLYISKGEYVVFTGQSGCGKSTLLKLLMGIYLPDDGRCYLQKKNGEKLEIGNEFIQLFAYVAQGNYLMSGTIRENIVFSDKEKMLDEQSIWYALKIACADEFVKELQDGIDSMLGEHGIGLSEGQMQRIAIARAIFSDNPILILDEVTSALDEDTEKRVLSNLRKMTDKTVLFVTHRPAGISVCDKEVRL